MHAAVVPITENLHKLLSRHYILFLQRIRTFYSRFVLRDQINPWYSKLYLPPNISQITTSTYNIPTHANKSTISETSLK